MGGLDLQEALHGVGVRLIVNELVMNLAQQDEVVVVVPLLRIEGGISAWAGRALSNDVAGLSDERFVVGLTGIHDQFSTTA
jgi:hypothetical protein